MANIVQNRLISEKDQWRNLEEYILFLKQKKAYQYATGQAEGKNVLDFGCGSGYGSDLLSEQAKSVIGVDVNKDAIAYCSETFKSANLSFELVTPDFKLRFESGSFDLITSFQVIEHIKDTKAYLSELKRVLKPGGILMITTPNRKYRLLPMQKPWHPEHLREYSVRQLKKDLKKVFSDIDIMGVYGSKEINKIEKNRVHQRPFDIYIKNQIRKATPDVFISKLKKIKEMHGPVNTLQAENFDKSILDKYSLDDFSVGYRESMYLDLLAVCKK